MFVKSFILTVVLMIFAGQVFAQAARDYISIVGSSTVYPFATVVAETFGKTTRFKTPKIESTGSGGGFKLFLWWNRNWASRHYQCLSCH